MSILRFTLAAICFVSLTTIEPKQIAAQVPADQVHDLALLVSPELPCVWPLGMTPMAIVTTKSIGLSDSFREMLIIDEHTGTQWDAPAHFVPPPDSGLPGAGPNGLITGEKVPAWQFCGEAIVIDVSKERDNAPAGSSFLIRPELVKAWEKSHRDLRFGDMVLFRSGYTDQYYLPFPNGDRFVSVPLRKGSPGWPAPHADTMEYIGSKGVMTLGLDSASMGPLPDLAVATHQAGGKLGMVWIECGTNLGKLPETGAFYAMLPAKHAGGSGGECRPLAITEPKLAATLIARAKAKQVSDLSVTLHEDYPITWPGRSAGEEATRYVGKVLNAFSKSRGPYFAMNHLFDSQAGTHLVLPATYLPGDDIERKSLAPDIEKSLAKFEAKHGKLKTSKLTIDRAPLNELMGQARVIDVRSLVGTAKQDSWPFSPIINLELVQKYEADKGALKPGDIVLFQTGHSDRYFKPLPDSPELDPMMAAPLAGKSEGWPTPSTDVIHYLASQGIRCIGTDAPTLGGVDAAQARELNWLAANHQLLVLEFLTNLDSIRDRNAFFMFAPIKIRGTKAGYGRAIALWE